MNAQQRNMPLLNVTLMETLSPLVDAASAIFEVDGVGKGVWHCFLIVMYYCCRIPEGRGMSCVKHGLVVRRPCMGCLETMDHTIVTR